MPNNSLNDLAHGKLCYVGDNIIAGEPSRKTRATLTSNKGGRNAQS
jgi:hypothetical protein